VGLYADLLESEPEEAEALKLRLDELSDYLVSIGLPGHEEPREGGQWGADMLGYSGLHTLRRLAAHLDAGEPLPEPGGPDSARDPVLRAYVDQATRPEPGVLGRIFRRRRAFARGFDHLIIHSDAEGVYLPADFEPVVFPPPELEIPGGMVGSAPRLIRELDRIAAVLGVPEELTSNSSELWDAEERQGSAGAGWERYFAEACSLVVLREGCREAVASGAALVFT